MKRWRNRKNVKNRKSKKGSDHYTFVDFVVDALFSIPELIMLPFRVIFWLVRGIGKMIQNIFDVV